MEPEQGSILLSPQELQDFLGAGVAWEAQPNLEKVTIRHGDELIDLVKKDVIARLQEDERLKLEDQPSEYFDKPESWGQIRSLIGEILNEGLKTAQPDEILLRAREEEYYNTLVKRQVPPNEARIMAKQYARSEGEMAKQEPKATTAAPRAVATPQTTASATAPQSEGLRPETQEIISRAQERAATGGVRWIEYFRHPVWAFNQALAYGKTYITTVFKKGFGEAEKAAKEAAQNVAQKTAGKAAGQVAKKVAGKVTKEATKAVATEVISGTAEAALAATGAGAVAAAAIEIAKRAWQLAKLAWSLLPKELREALKKLAAGTTLAAFFIVQYLMSHLFATALAAGAMFFGGPVFGAAIAPAAFVLGLGLEGVTTSLLGTLSTIGTTVVPAAVTGATLGALIGGAGIATFSLAAILAPLLISGIVIVAATAAPAEDQGVKVTFRLEQTVEPAAIDAYDGTEKEIKYHLTISTPSDKPVAIKSVAYTISTTGTDTPPPQTKATLPAGPVTSAEPFKIDYSIIIADPKYQNSVILNTVKVVGRGEGETEDETETVTTKLTVGTPQFRQPFGFPAAGTIMSVDIEPVKCVSQENPSDKVDPYRDATGRPVGCPAGYKEKNHCGSLLDLYGKNIYNCLKGGLDISGPQTAVYSTIEGTVIKSVFDRGPISVTCTPLTSATGFCHPALGGAVYIESLDKKYTVAFLHLDKEGLIAQGQTVARGQPIGQTFAGEPGKVSNKPGKICEIRGDKEDCTSSGIHLHYQIFTDHVNNVNFADSQNIGSCKTGALLSGAVPRLYDSITDPLASQKCE